jgi:hypothetical protein
MKLTITAFTFFLFSPVLLNAQWSYIGKIGDSCTPAIHYQYTYETFEVGTHGMGFLITRDDTIIYYEPGNGYDCCGFHYFQPFSDSNVCFVWQGAYTPSICTETNDAGHTWKQIYYWWGEENFIDCNFINSHSFYAITRTVTQSFNFLLNIRRVSDIMNRTVLSNDPVDMSISQVVLHDTIFGESFCPGIDSIGFRVFKNDSIKEYWIFLTKVPYGIQQHISNEILRMHPNPAHSSLTIEVSQKGKLYIFSQLGSIVQEIQLSEKQTTIDISRLSQGLFLLKFLDYKNNVVYTKFIKQ